MKIYSFFILLLVALSACAQNTTTDSDGKQIPVVKNLTQEEFKAKFEKQEDLQLLDVRTPVEIASGKIGQAKELDIFDPNFEQKIEELAFDKTKPVVIYCKSGGRSSRAADIFIAHGYTQVYNLVGGYSNY